MTREVSRVSKEQEIIVIDDPWKDQAPFPKGTVLHRVWHKMDQRRTFNKFRRWTKDLLISREYRESFYQQPTID